MGVVSAENISRTDDLLIVPTSNSTAEDRLAWKKYGSSIGYVTAYYRYHDSEGFDVARGFYVLADGRVASRLYDPDGFNSKERVDILIGSLANFVVENHL